MKQLDLFPVAAHLTRIDPETNMERYCSLTVLPDLFGGSALVRSWGRIGRNSTTRIELHADEGAAIDALEGWYRRKLHRAYVAE